MNDFEVPVESISEIETPLYNPDVINEIAQIMLAHGGRLEILEKHSDRQETQEKSCKIYFPPGTTKTLLIPVTIHTRYIIRFPDGLELKEEDTRTQARYIRFPLDLFSPGIQKKYRR